MPAAYSMFCVATWRSNSASHAVWSPIPAHALDHLKECRNLATFRYESNAVHSRYLPSGRTGPFGPPFACDISYCVRAACDSRRAFHPARCYVCGRGINLLCMYRSSVINIHKLNVLDYFHTYKTATRICSNFSASISDLAAWITRLLAVWLTHGAPMDKWE